MNELIGFFSTIQIGWVEASIIALVIGGGAGFVVKKAKGKKKKHWSESNLHEDQILGADSRTNNSLNYASVMTEDVNSFLMPKVAINDPKEQQQIQEMEELFRTEIKSEKSSNKNTNNETVKYEQNIKNDDFQHHIEVKELFNVEKTIKEDRSSFTDHLNKQLTIEEDLIKNIPILTQEDTAPKNEKSSEPAFNLELPSLTTLYPSPSPKIENDFEYFDLTPDEPVNLTTELNTPEIEPFHLDIDEPANIVLDKTREEVKEKTNEIEFLPSDSFKKEFQYTPELEEKQNIIEVESISPVITKPTYYTGIPTLTEIVTELPVHTPLIPNPTIVAPPINLDTVTEAKAKLEEKFLPRVKPEIDESKFEFTKKYHALIDKALDFDAENNKEQAMLSLIEAGKLIENIRVNFYLKIAIQSYKNATTNNSLPSIINQFYIIEKEKLIKEEYQKTQEADLAFLKSKKLTSIETHPPLVENKLPINSINTVNEPTLEAPVLKLSSTETLTPQNKELQEFITEVNSISLEEITPTPEPILITVNEDEPPIVFAAFEDPVVHESVETLSSDTPLSPVAESIQQQIEQIDIVETVVEQPSLDKTFNDNNSSVFENIQLENTNTDISESYTNNTTLLNDDSKSSVFDLIIEPVINDVQNTTQIDSPTLDSTKETIPHLDESLNQLEPITLPTLKPIQYNIEDEFSDDETKDQFMEAFGDMFKHKSNTENLEPQIIIPQKRKHTVWVNWISTDAGKMNFENDMIELNAVWGTKTAIQDLHIQLQEKVGEGNQFSVVSVFEAK